MKKNLKYIIIFVAIIMVFGLFLIRYKTSRTIEKILDVDFNDIAYVTYGGAMSHDMNYDLDKFINEYKNKKYKRFGGDRGSTAHRYFVCYDKNGNVILTVVEIGNRDLVFLKKGKFNINMDSKKIYQLATK